MKEQLLKLALAAYIGEMCRICGELIDKSQIDDAIYVGYNENSRIVHGACWELKNQKERAEACGNC